MVQSLPPSCSQLLVTQQQNSTFLSWIKHTHARGRLWGCIHNTHLHQKMCVGSRSTTGLEYMQFNSVTHTVQCVLRLHHQIKSFKWERVKGKQNKATVIIQSMFPVTAFESSGLLPSLNTVSCFYLHFCVISATKWSKWLSVKQHMWFVLN